MTLLIAGCADLSGIEPGVCGNRVLEPDALEECDGSDGCGAPDTANACKLVCDQAACPTGYQCSPVDQRCRQPTERFIWTATEVSAPIDISAADMDHDGYADLLGSDLRGLVLRWGDWEGTFASSSRVSMFAAGEAAILDADADQDHDIAVPLGELGLALFAGDGGRTLEPAPQTAILFPSLDGEECMTLSGGGLQSTLDEPQILMVVGGLMLMFIDNPDACGEAPDISPDCIVSPTGGELVGGRVHIGDLGYGYADGVNPGDHFAATVYGSDRLTVWGVHAIERRPHKLENLRLSAPIPDNGHIWLGQFTPGDGCLDVAVDLGGQIDVFYGNSGAGGCTGLSTTADTFVLPGSMVTAADLDGDGVDEILFQSELGGTTLRAYEHDGASWVNRPTPFEHPGFAVTIDRLDFNGDHWEDLLVTRGGETLDFLLNYRGEGFNVFSVDAGGFVRTPEVGDFDGDLLDDVAVAVINPLDPFGRDTLSIAYGDPGARPDVVEIGEFTASARPALVRGGLQPHLDSMLVISNHADQGTCDRRIAILVGDTTRQLFSPFVLTYGDGIDREPVSVKAIADVTWSDSAAQVLALGTDVPLDASQPPTESIMTVLDFEGSSFRVQSQVVAPATAMDPSTLEGSIVRAGSLVPGAPPTVALVGDNVINAAKVDTWAVSTATLPTAMRAPAFVELVDMDLDGDADLVGGGGAAFADPSGEGASATSLWMIASDGEQLALDAPIIVTPPDELTCYDAETIRSTTDGRPQIIALCARASGDTYVKALVIGTLDPERDQQALLDVRYLDLDVGQWSIEVADFTGDGLDDIALVGAVTVLLRQCRADEIATTGCLALSPL